MYKPNFCAECGERVTRTRWHFWTSRRFCHACARRFRRSRLLWPFLSGTVLFVLGLAAGRGSRPHPPPLIVERGQLSLAPTPALITKGGASTVGPKTGPDMTTATKAESTYAPDGTAIERPTDPNEIVSICGARTKKGTPCQRRVRGTGRCWQHRGMPAMLPPSKLIVQG